MIRNTLSARHIVMALAVSLLWGLNFVAIKIGLQSIPPFLMGALRFALVALPWILLLPPPKVDIKTLMGYGLTISFGQFAFLFSAIASGMPSGIASLVLQMQAFFTVAIAAFAYQEKLLLNNLLGMSIAFIGLVILYIPSMIMPVGKLPLLGLVLTLGAALSWAIGNIICKRAGTGNSLNLVVWGAAVPIVPFLILSWLFEGPDKIFLAVQEMSLASGLAIVFMSFAATLIGYTLWGKLLSEVSAQVVTPFALLVPVVGLTASWIVFAESLSQLQCLGAMIVACGLLVNMFGIYIRRLRA